MPQLEFDRRVAYSPEQMIALVSDLPSYPRFIPNCRSMEVNPDRLSSGDVRFATKGH